MHAMSFTHFVFGGFLMYTGIKTASADEEDKDPSQQPVVLWLPSHVPFVNVYGSKGEFCVHCPIKENGQPDIPEDAIVTPEPSEKGEGEMNVLVFAIVFLIQPVFQCNCFCLHVPCIVLLI